MSTQHLQTLVYFAQAELPLLQHDIDNASTLFTLQAICKRMHNVLTVMVHHAILDAYARMGAIPQAAPPPRAPAPPPTPAPAPTIASAYLPMMPVVPFPNPAHGVAIPPNPGAQGQQAGPISEVFVTPQGTKVIPPGGGPPAVLPPGTSVDTTQFIPATIMSGMMPVTAPAPAPPAGPIVEVGLPQGGGMTPEVMAALARARDTHVPPAPAPDATGGARNITREPPSAQ